MQFTQIVGQRHLINSLVKTVKEGRIPHARLFAGAEGYGGFALALAYAQFVSCTDRQYFDTEDDNELCGDSCGKCPSCIKYSRLEHPDLHFIFPNTTTGQVDKNNESALLMDRFREFVFEKEGYIDTDSWFDYLKVDNKQGEINVRDANTIIRNLTLTTYESRYRVMIIWGADRLRHDAAPKLLKILEEPYEGTLFLLVSANTEAILPTILSRTQLVKVLPIESAAVERFLVEKKGLDIAQARIAAVNSEGDLIKAIGCASNAGGESVEMFIQWMRTAFQYRTKAVEAITISEQLAKMGRETQKSFLAECESLLRECLRANLGIDVSAGMLSGENAQFRSKFSAFVRPDNFSRIFALLEQARYHISRNANPKILFFDLTLKLGAELSKKQINT